MQRYHGFVVPSILNRYIIFGLCWLLAVIALILVVDTGRYWVPLGIFLGLGLLGLYDIVQTRHAVLRNYPVIGHARYLFESVRPELRQYLFENDSDKVPFSRVQRSLVYQRAKNEPDQRPFGTLQDVYQRGYEFIGHSVRPAPVADPKTFRVTIGNDQCSQPYSASVLNVSAMSFGSLSANAIRALNRGASLGGFCHDTGEGSVSPYHMENGGDLVWQIASGYFGCRTEAGLFDPEKFAARAASPQIRMIELKLSQGAKPGHGGILPGHKVSAEIAAVRGVPEGVDCISPASHPSFDTPIGMLHFLAELRRLSGGKPVGFKLAIGHPWQFMSIVKAMLATGIVPDFVVVDGSEGGTGAAPVEFTDHIGVPMREGLLFVHNTLVGVGLRHRVRVGVSGKIISAFDMARVFAIGADWANSARGFMFAIGCIQSLHCHTNKCPTGVATQDKLRQRSLVVPDKADRVAAFHRHTLGALAEMLAAAGLSHPSELGPQHLAQRVSSSEIQLLSQLHVFLKPGELLDPPESASTSFYHRSWSLAQAESFDVLPS
ncbi:FMN-binding glutamate synthase family protein [Kaistia algarum]|uniref:FMN-binding glutamate synthase family protein n=1 Tax=Kaistia algarum TaxID=2083279 RepID=UPI000CE79182|nr:FMN-binding glutamate synthase family protein [Kaistia algarum]MCX5515537.1 FMN-binding glutamate synthase family protein [Kaistia algarum]PPE81062.1 FMN-binding glutamate synthase family protein [Kaistia algarum]